MDADHNVVGTQALGQSLVREFDSKRIRFRSAANSTIGLRVRHSLVGYELRML